MQQRLHKVIAQTGVSSRRTAEKLIKAGKVMVNGKVVTELGTKIDLQYDSVIINGKKIELESHVYFLLHKPAGVITTVHDEKGRKSVVDFFTNIPERVFPVGRLDQNTTGVLIITNDGEVANKLLHPHYQVEKVYEATVQGIATKHKLDQLRHGVALKDGITAVANISIISTNAKRKETKIKITIHEGKNRIVRRMFGFIGYPVLSLKRVRFGPIVLDDLKEGAYRQLNEKEINLLTKH